MEPFCKKSLQLLAVNYFGKKASSSMFDWVFKYASVVGQVDLVQEQCGLRN